MKIEQSKTEFKPITITFERKEEAEAFIKLIDNTKWIEDKNVHDLCITIANWFSNKGVI
jgi:hypothetical protein